MNLIATSNSMYGYLIVFSTGILSEKYTGEDITLTLPESMSWRSLRWLSMWCRQYREDFGHVMIPQNLNVPPYIEPMQEVSLVSSTSFYSVHKNTSQWYSGKK